MYFDPFRSGAYYCIEIISEFVNVIKILRNIGKYFDVFLTVHHSIDLFQLPT